MAVFLFLLYLLLKRYDVILVETQESREKHWNLMGGFSFNDNGGIIGNWLPLSPSPRSLFAAVLGESRSESEKYETGNDGVFTFPGPERLIGSKHGEVTQRGDIVDPVVKGSPRAGLVERMAARTGHNAPRLNTDIVKPVYGARNQQSQSPYLTVSPGLSPGAFLESPVFLSNSLVQPSPTTGKFQFSPNGNSIDNMSKDNFFEDSSNISFAFKTFLDSAPISSDHSNEALIQPDEQFRPQKSEPVQNYLNVTEKKNFSLQMAPFEPHNGNSELTQQHHEKNHDDIDADQSINGDISITNASSASSDDGYNWRKYGQKQVKGSEYPRSYYKCTHPKCTMKKTVERSFEGHITEIIYKGAHNHPKVAPTRRSAIGSSSVLSDVSELTGNGVDGGHVWGTNMRGQESNIEVTSSAMVMQGQSGQLESSDAVDGSSSFSYDEEDDRATHGSVSLGYDGEGDESESKRRKVEAYAADVSGATRAIREPRVVVQTTSDVDILDDGYRWRKYGQKVVKGNPNPRSYYKCTSTGCTVRKHVERASHDLRSVITTYEGKHNHDVPAARNSSHNNTTIQPQLQMPGLSRGQNTNLPSDQHLGSAPIHGYGYPMNQQGPGGRMPVLPLHHYLNQPQQMVSKGKPKAEPMSDPGLNLGSGAAIYHHMMNRLPLGHQM